MKKIIVAHIGKQHSFKTAEAFYRKEALFQYITTVYDKPYSLTRVLKFMLRGKNKKKCASRKTEMIPNEYITQFCEHYGLLFLFISRIPFLKKYKHSLNKHFVSRFGYKVAKYAIKNNVDAVVMYDTNTNECWDVLKKEAPGIKRILDVTIANRLFMKANFITDMQLTKSNNLKNEQKHLWDDSNILSYKKELVDSDIFLVASNMVKRSLLFSGVSEHNIFIIPYGVDSNKFKFVKKELVQLPLKLIYVGEISYRKGLHHLLDVMLLFSKKEVVLTICGQYDNQSELYLKFQNYENIEFLGFVTRDELASEYQNSDVFVFPTLGEGYGLVVLEALSCGLPCIVSNLAGGDDAITDNFNGFVFNAGDKVDLKNKIQWFIDNRDLIADMSENSAKSSRYYTWERYYEGVYGAVKNILG